MTKRAITGSDIFDGRRIHKNMAFILDGDLFEGIVPVQNIPTDCEVEETTGGTILPGFVDLQVNGGGGVMFNDETSVDGLKAIAEAHAKSGTRALLPTLITDTPERTKAAMDAVEAAIAQKIPGIIGLHLEGPHLSIARKGAHDPALIRPMQDADEEFLLQAAKRIPNLMVTVAPDIVRCDQIARLAKGGVIVSLGHSDCRFAEARAAFDAGAVCVTHLFNAMSQMANREPGLVGATLSSGAVSAGLIADDIHVHSANMQIALDAKRAPGTLFLVTDAMATAGSEIMEFQLNGRTVLRNNDRLTLRDGTLAGAHLDFPRAISVLVNEVGVPLVRALAMATSGPSGILPRPAEAGGFVPGCLANGIILNGSFSNVRAC